MPRVTAVAVGGSLVGGELLGVGDHVRSDHTEFPLDAAQVLLGGAHAGGQFFVGDLPLVVAGELTPPSLENVGVEFLVAGTVAVSVSALVSAGTSPSSARR